MSVPICFCGTDISTYAWLSRGSRPVIDASICAGSGAIKRCVSIRYKKNDTVDSVIGKYYNKQTFPFCPDDKAFTMAVAIDVPSHMRPVPGSINITAAEFPQAVKPVKPIQPSEIAADFVSTFNTALQRKNLLDVSLLFLEGGFWRDHLALTWQLRTLQGPARIYDFLKGAATSKDGFRIKKIDVDSSNAVRAPRLAPVDADGEVIGVQFFLTIDTAIGTGQGLVRLVEEAGTWKIFTLYTRLEELKGHEEAIYDNRPRGVEHGGKPGRQNWADRRAAALDYTDGSEPAVVVVGRSTQIPCQ